MSESTCITHRSVDKNKLKSGTPKDSLGMMFRSCLLILVITWDCTNGAFLDDNEWMKYKIKFKKSYSLNEEITRYDIWRENNVKVQTHNQKYQNGEVTYKLAMNKYADMTSKEFLRTMTGYSSNEYMPPDELWEKPMISGDLPITVDWRRENIVTDVKDQFGCGACWAFSATGALEGQHAKKTGNLVPLSEQNLVDCSYTQGNNGCYGGLMTRAFQYVVTNDGIDKEKEYKYAAGDRLFCHYKKLFRGATASNYTALPSGNETALQWAVAGVGPVSVGIEAWDSFQLYDSGVYYNKECTGTGLNHAVLAVGYGTYLGDDYWLIKNSWGTDWGMEGYAMMARNRENNCGIASQASFPIM